MLDLHQFSTAIDNSTEFKNSEPYKKILVKKRASLLRLHDYYQQAHKYGIDYLKQNPNLFAGDVKLINEVLNNV